VTNTFRSKHDKKPSKTRAVKKDWKKVFDSARKLKESPIIPNNYYQSDDDDDDDDDDFWDGWYCDDSSHISDANSLPYFCICVSNEGHKDRDDPKVYQQQFHQRKQTRKTCINWNIMINQRLRYYNNYEYYLDGCISDNDPDWDDVCSRMYYTESDSDDKSDTDTESDESYESYESYERYPDPENNERYPDHNPYWESQW